MNLLIWMFAGLSIGWLSGRRHRRNVDAVERFFGLRRGSAGHRSGDCVRPYADDVGRFRERPQGLRACPIAFDRSMHEFC